MRRSACCFSLAFPRTITWRRSWGSRYTRKVPDEGHGPISDETWQSWAKEFKFEKFNAQQWVEIAQKAGFKYFVAQAKHHEGFHWWDTAYSDFKVTKTPFGRDLLKEQADACHAAGMALRNILCAARVASPGLSASGRIQTSRRRNVVESLSQAK